MTVDVIYQIERTILPYECDWKGNLLLSQALGMMMLASRKQQQQLQNPNLIYEKGYTWIVIQHEIEIQRMPKVDEEVIIETQAISYNKFFTYREYRILSKEREELFECITTFAMLDMKARKIVSIDEEIVLEYPLSIGKEMRKATRIPKKDFSDATTGEYKIRINDIDANLHVNNARYFDFAFSELGMEFLEDHQLKQVVIKYEKEVLPESTISCSTLWEENTLESQERRQTYHLISQDGNRCANIQMKWEEIV